MDGLEDQLAVAFSYAPISVACQSSGSTPPIDPQRVVRYLLRYPDASSSRSALGADDTPGWTR